jgi:cytoskeletal protein RodZ
LDLFDPGAEDDREFAELSKPAQPKQEGQSRPQVIGGVIAAIILIVLLVLLGRFIYHKVNNSPAKNVSVTTQPSPQTSSSSTQSGSSSGSSASGSSTSGSSSSTAPNSSGRTAPIASTGKLPNNGPGSTVAIFAVSSLAAAGLHYIISLRRSSKYLS